MALKVIYMILVGILVSIFVGVGIDAFYTAPEYPKYPEMIVKAPVDGEIDDEASRKVMEDYQKEYDRVDKEHKIYNRNVSIIAIVSSVLIALVSIILHSKTSVISDGLLLGSVLTLLYSVARGFGSDNEKFRFVITAICLIIVLAIGYWKFIRGEIKNSK